MSTLQKMLSMFFLLLILFMVKFSILSKAESVELLRESGVTLSTDVSSNLVANIKDNNTSTNWNSTIQTSTAPYTFTPHYITADFGNVKTFNRVVINDAASRLVEYDIEIWEDNAWKLIKNTKLNRLYGSLEVPIQDTFEPVSSQKIKLTFKKVMAGQTACFIQEAYVYSDPVAISGTVDARWSVFSKVKATATGATSYQWYRGDSATPTQWTNVGNKQEYFFSFDNDLLKYFKCVATTSGGDIESEVIGPVSGNLMVNRNVWGLVTNSIDNNLSTSAATTSGAGVYGDFRIGTAGDSTVVGNTVNSFYMQLDSTSTNLSSYVLKGGFATTGHTQFHSANANGSTTISAQFAPQNLGELYFDSTLSSGSSITIKEAMAFANVGVTEENGYLVATYGGRNNDVTPTYKWYIADVASPTSDDYNEINGENNQQLLIKSDYIGKKIIACVSIGYNQQIIGGGGEVAPVTIRFESDGLLTSATALYYYNNPSKELESETNVSWYYKDTNQQYILIPNQTERHLVIDPQLYGKELAVRVDSEAIDNTVIPPRFSCPYVIPTNIAYSKFSNSIVYYPSSTWMLGKAERIKAVPTNEYLAPYLYEGTVYIPVVQTCTVFGIPVPPTVPNSQVIEGIVFAPYDTFATTVGFWSQRNGDTVVLSPNSLTITTQEYNEARTALLYNETYSNTISTAQSFFAKMNLNSPELLSIKQLVDGGQYIEALEQYKIRFIDYSATLGLRTGFKVISGLGSGGSTAQQLMQDIFTYKDYNTGQIYTFNNLGKAGYITWHPVQNVSNDFIIHSSTMCFLDVLVSEFKNTGDIKYIEKWAAILEDNFMHSYEQWNYIMTSPLVSLYSSSFPVVWDNIFYSSLRTIAVNNQFAVAASYDAEKFKRSLSALSLSRIINTMVEKNNITLYRSTIIPNQEMQAIKALLNNSIIYKDFTEGALYNSTAEAKTDNYANSGLMQDGSDLEQTPAYNLYGIPDAFNYAIDIFNGDYYSWIPQKLFPMARNRVLFLSGMLKPNGQYPNLQGTGDSSYKNWLSKLKDRVNDNTVTAIYDNVFNSVYAVQPNFKSIYYPYGGYFVMRENWGANSKYLFMKNSRRGSGHYDESFNHIVLNAYGQNLLVGGGGANYAASWENEFMHSSWSKNTINVDGYSQVIGAEPANTSSYTNTIGTSRWLTTDYFDFGEGVYDKSYGIAKAEKGPNNKVISDVTHRRQVIYIKEYGVYIVTDKLSSPSTHTYELNWNFGPIYSSGNVVANPLTKSIKATSSTYPKLSIYSLSSKTLTTDLYYGENSGIIRGFYKSTRFSTPVPIVESSTKFTSNNGGVIVSVIFPYNSTSENITVLDIGSGDGTVEGVRVTFSDDTVINYKYAVNASSSLVVGDYSCVGEGILTVDKNDGVIKGILLNSNNLYDQGTQIPIMYPNSQFIYQSGSAIQTQIIKCPVVSSWILNGSDSEYFID